MRLPRILSFAAFIAATALTSAQEPKADEPKFSTTDANATLRWLVHVSKDYRDAAGKGNAVAEKKAKDALRKEFRNAKGETVTWILPVISVYPKSIEVGRVAWRADTRYRLAVGVSPSAAERPFFPYQAGEWAEKLRRGDAVKVTGKVVVIHYAKDYNVFVIQLKNAEAAPKD